MTEELLEVVTSERRAEGFKHWAAGEPSTFRRLCWHPLETLQEKSANEPKSQGHTV